MIERNDYAKSDQNPYPFVQIIQDFCQLMMSAMLSFSAYG